MYYFFEDIYYERNKKQTSRGAEPFLKEPALRQANKKRRAFIMARFKMEVAQELGVPLSNGYNGNLTSAQNGSVGGYMVKKMIEAQEKQMAGK